MKQRDRAKQRMGVWSGKVEMLGSQRQTLRIMFEWVKDMATKHVVEKPVKQGQFLRWTAQEASSTRGFSHYQAQVTRISYFQHRIYRLFRLYSSLVYSSKCAQQIFMSMATVRFDQTCMFSDSVFDRSFQRSSVVLAFLQFHKFNQFQKILKF